MSDPERSTIIGVLDKLDQKLEKHITDSNIHREYMNAFVTKTNAFITKMEPVESGLITFTSLARFSKSLGIPSLFIVLLWLYHKIFN